MLIGFVVYGLYYAYVMHLLKQTQQDILNSAQKSSQQLLERSQKMQAEQARARDEKAQQAKAAAAQAAQQEADIVQAQLRAQEKVRLQLQRKEEAWKALYKPTQKCIDDPVTTECANAHIKAKNRFEASYKLTEDN